MRLPAAILLSALLVASSAAQARGAGKGSGKARSAVSGQYVKKGYAAKNPRTTVVERDRVKKP